MSEEETKPEEEESQEDSSSDMINKANLVALRLEEANKKTEELLNKKEALATKQILAGHAEAGQEPQKLDETPEEYKTRVMSGALN